MEQIKRRSRGVDFPGTWHGKFIKCIIDIFKGKKCKHTWRYGYFHAWCPKCGKIFGDLMLEIEMTRKIQNFYEKIIKASKRSSEQLIKEIELVKKGTPSKKWKYIEKSILEELKEEKTK